MRNAHFVVASLLVVSAFIAGWMLSSPPRVEAALPQEVAQPVVIELRVDADCIVGVCDTFGDPIYGSARVLAGETWKTECRFPMPSPVILSVETIDHGDQDAGR